MNAIVRIPTLSVGAGAVAELPKWFKDHGVRRPMLISDPGIVRAGHFDRVKDLIDDRYPTASFCEVPENPTYAGVDAAADIYRSSECDIVVALGGGSVIDTAKFVAVLGRHAGHAADYVGFSELVTEATAPIIAIPTTAGTGSESSPDAGIHPDAISLSSGISSMHVVPRVAICDPELTATLPRHLTAATALDALSHCVEGYLAVGDHPIADALALDGIARVSKNVSRAIHDSDVATRTQMMWGAFAGGVAIGKGLGPAHAIAISCGDQGVHHGILSALGLVACLVLVEAAVPDRCLNVRLALGTPDGRSLSEDVLVLMRQVGMPTSLSMARYEVVDLERTAAACAQSHFNFTSRIRPTHEQFKMMITSIV
jgi:4-hydroxybutyrate dehydrogenase